MVQSDLQLEKGACGNRWATFCTCFDSQPKNQPLCRSRGVPQLKTQDSSLFSLMNLGSELPYLHGLDTSAQIPTSATLDSYEKHPKCFLECTVWLTTHRSIAARSTSHTTPCGRWLCHRNPWGTQLQLAAWRNLRTAFVVAFVCSSLQFCKFSYASQRAYEGVRVALHHLAVII